MCVCFDSLLLIFSFIWFPFRSWSELKTKSTVQTQHEGYLCIYLYIHTILVLTFLGYFYLVFVFNRFNDYLFWSNFQLAFVTFYIQSLFLLLFLCVLSQRKDCVIRKVCLIFPITQGPSQYFCYDFEVLEQKEAKEN